MSGDRSGDRKRSQPSDPVRLLCGLRPPRRLLGQAQRRGTRLGGCGRARTAHRGPGRGRRPTGERNRPARGVLGVSGAATDERAARAYRRRRRRCRGPGSRARSTRRSRRAPTATTRPPGSRACEAEITAADFLPPSLGPRRDAPALLRSAERDPRRPRPLGARAAGHAPAAPAGGPVRLRAGPGRQLRGRAARGAVQRQSPGGGPAGRVPVSLAPRPVAGARVPQAGLSLRPRPGRGARLRPGAGAS